VIRSFRERETALIWTGFQSRHFPADIQSVALRKLMMLHRAKTIQDLRIPPANRLEMLRGRRRGQWSIRINRQYRICFRWLEGDAHDVEIVDYHDE
jgi:proteic killer suppression protein